MRNPVRFKIKFSDFKSHFRLGLALLIVASLFQPAASAISPSTIKITVHYQRAASDYADWDLWLWRHPWNGNDGNVDSKGVKFTEEDKFGKIAIVSVDGLDKYTSVAFIVRRGGVAWLEKDITDDRYIEKFNSDGTAEIWLIQGDREIYYQDPAVAKAAADKAAADKAAADKAAAAKAAAAAKKTTITCIKGKSVKKVTAVKPKCPAGYKIKK